MHLRIGFTFIMGHTDRRFCCLKAVQLQLQSVDHHRPGIWDNEATVTRILDFMVGIQALALYFPKLAPTAYQKCWVWSRVSNHHCSTDYGLFFSRFDQRKGFLWYHPKSQDDNIIDKSVWSDISFWSVKLLWAALWPAPSYSALLCSTRFLPQHSQLVNLRMKLDKPFLKQYIYIHIVT